MEPSIKIYSPGLFILEVTDNDNCKGKDSTLVIQKLCNVGVYIPSAFSPNGDNLNDVFKARIFGTVESFELDIFDRWGTPIFKTNDPQKGWDGKIKGIDEATGVFVWQCFYRLKGQESTYKRGTVTLVR
jgi:gliding motility-associated-like protein